MNPSGAIIIVLATLVISQVTLGGALERLGIIKSDG